MNNTVVVEPVVVREGPAPGTVLSSKTNSASNTSVMHETLKVNGADIAVPPAAPVTKDYFYNNKTEGTDYSAIDLAAAHENLLPDNPIAHQVLSEDNMGAYGKKHRGTGDHVAAAPGASGAPHKTHFWNRNKHAADAAPVGTDAHGRAAPVSEPILHPTNVATTSTTVVSEPMTTTKVVPGQTY
eukprot:TRINITY_DN4233_c0_g2_i2.p1 TRINITY_DN4233_c0_g2~~TRINITY_DN4233_c0_g2_i2.p1  ORF type:complete len:184 (+),score=38.83 TRINITY_DN4233_c0_g2_i2:142-693(+)